MLSAKDDAEKIALVRRADPSEDGWQRRLLPLMVRAVVVLAVFFFVVTLGQLSYIHWQLRQTRESTIPVAVSELTAAPVDPEPNLARAWLGIAALLEEEAMARRYDMASVTLMAHIWIRYMGFVTGMIMAVIGAVFILGKLRDQQSTQLGAEAKDIKLSLTSASPGLVLATLGATLMIVTVLAQQTTEVNDGSIYRPFAKSTSTEPQTEAQKVWPDFFGAPNTPQAKSPEATEGKRP